MYVLSGGIDVDQHLEVQPGIDHAPATVGKADQAMTDRKSITRT
jgi:hypothetical protein